MPLNWSNLPQSRMCIVTRDGAVTRADIDAYLAGTIREGVKGFAKLVDIMSCTLALSADDASYAESYDPNALPAGMAGRGHGLRPS
jgi:hypothetical protein